MGGGRRGINGVNMFQVANGQFKSYHVLNVRAHMLTMVVIMANG